MRKVKSEESAEARSRLLASGAKIFAVKPFDEVAIDDITDDAGVAHGLLFHYFKTKLEFYVEVYKGFLEDLHQRRLLETRNGTPEQRLRSFIEFHMSVFHKRLRSHLYHTRGGAPPKVVAVAEASRQDGVRLVLSYFSNVEPTPAQFQLGRAWLAFADELILGWLQDERLPREAVVQTCIEVYYEVMARAETFRKRGREKAPANDRA